MTGMSTPLAHFFPRGILRDLAAAADADDDPVRFEWLCLEDSNPGDVNAPPQVAAGALVFVRGDENAKALAAWAEKSRLLTPRVVSTVKTTAIDLRRELAALLKAAADKADEWRKAAQDEWAPLAPDYHAGNGEVTPAIEGSYVEHRLAMGVGNDIRRIADHLAFDPDNTKVAQ